MKILALELSSSLGSIACLDQAQERFSVSFANDRKHSGLFFENLQRCLEQFGNPERIIVGLGPGSYAGTRIAIATAVGLQAASAAELIGLPSLCAMETKAPTYAVIGDARRQSFFFAEVRDRLCVEGPALFPADELAERLGSYEHPILSAELLPAFPIATQFAPSALILAQLGRAASASTSDAPLEPLYLREPHITQAKAPMLSVQS